MAEVLSFVAPRSVNNVAFRSDAVIGFDRLPGNMYRVFLIGGNHVDIQAGYWEYERLIKAMEQNAYREKTLLQYAGGEMG